MTAILRVKRRHDGLKPSDALVISYKRQKTDETEDTESVSPVPLTTLAKFAGTVNKQEDSVDHIIQTYGKDELKANFKQHPVDILNKVRKRTKEASAENRYKVVNYFRSLDDNTLKEIENKNMTVIDLEDSKSMAKEDSVEKDNSYVYDLYYMQTDNDMYIDNMVSVYPYEQELVYDTCGENYCEAECESEDSNSESNWRNDYPNSSHSDRSIDVDDMMEAVGNMRLEECDSSEEDDFVYALNELDVNRYGYEYARYKARIKKELEEESEDGFDDDDDGEKVDINVFDEHDKGIYREEDDINVFDELDKDMYREEDDIDVLAEFDQGIYCEENDINVFDELDKNVYCEDKLGSAEEDEVYSDARLTDYSPRCGSLYSSAGE